MSPPYAIKLDMPIMVGVAIACLPLFWPGKQLGRIEAGGFLFYYIAYMTYLVFISIQHPLEQTMEWWMVWVIMPVTVVLIITKFVGMIKESGFRFSWIKNENIICRDEDFCDQAVEIPNLNPISYTNNLKCITQDTLSV
ncbi:hypothetical protein [Rhodohalobacter sp.]|uniref:hypothetical protein n=1 Tax=Rhodohalobacter sp. TaxID=1974210 RepID=UPI002ACD9C11|nr:hypothetical protein [Rhodohalobacter sp.]MDZ7756282.1 hypothetical protein [Rhodohalobacter sp.]